MKNQFKLLLVGIMLVAAALLLIPAVAQEDEGGGVIIDSSFGSGPDTLSPIYCVDTACDDLVAFMFPGLIGVDPATKTLLRGAPGALVIDWVISEDNLVYTFTLRQDYFWSDGTPITAYDVEYHWDVISSPEAQSPNSFYLDLIADVVALDDYTVQFTFLNPECTALSNAASIVPVPRHVLGDDFSALPASTENVSPTVTAGVFRFGEFRPSDQTTLLADDNYTDAALGYVAPDAYIYKVVPDQTVQVEQLLAGEINFLDNPPVNRRDELRASDELQVFSFPGISWDFIGLNLADPTDPQPAVDADGNRIDQGLHPIFGDVRVRRAIAHAVDVEVIIDGAVFGEGTRMTSAILPSSWAYNHDLPPIPFDPDLADQLLTEAGWLDEDGDGIRECVSCETAEPGARLAFTLYTNQGNTRREAVGTIVQDQLLNIPNGGFDVDFQTIDFNTMIDLRNTQTFDAVIAGFQDSLIPDPNSYVQLFGVAADVPSAGFNFSSYYNERVNELLLVGGSLPGCDQAERLPYYLEMQEILQQDLPYIFLYAIDGMYAARTEISGFNPYPSFPYWNIDTWTVTR